MTSLRLNCNGFCNFFGIKRCYVVKSIQFPTFTFLLSDSVFLNEQDVVIGRGRFTPDTGLFKHKE